MAGRVADTIRTGGQEVKEIVVEGAEQVIAAAKPKIQYGMSKIAWRVRLCVVCGLMPSMPTCCSWFCTTTCLSEDRQCTVLFVFACSAGARN